MYKNIIRGFVSLKTNFLPCVIVIDDQLAGCVFAGLGAGRSLVIGS